MKSTPILRRLASAWLVVVALTACGTTGGGAVDVPLSDRPLVGKFVWHDLITDDAAVVKRFYGDLLGWQFEKTAHPLGADYTLITSGGRYVGGIVQRADAPQADYSRWLPYLSVADVDAAVDLTESAGGTAVVAPVELGSIARAAAVTDPQGAVLGLLRSHVGDPADSAPTPPGGAVWNELLAADDAAAADYYRGLAGLEPRRIARRGGEYTLLRTGGIERAGILQRPDDRVTPQWMTFFGVPDVDAAARRAAELGGEVLLAPSPELREGTLAVVVDPSGAVFALQEHSR